MPNKKPASKRSGTKKIGWVIGLSIAAGAVLIALSLSSARPKGEAVKSDAELNALRSTKGAEKARVTLVEFGDYQ